MKGSGEVKVLHEEHDDEVRLPFGSASRKKKKGKPRFMVILRILWRWKFFMKNMVMLLGCLVGVPPEREKKGKPRLVLTEK